MIKYRAACLFQFYYNKPMTITTIQKVIKIGSSHGMTLPAKQMRALGWQEGDEVRNVVDTVSSAHTPVQPVTDQVRRDYETFTQQYGETLKNLADR